jgi:hypothetical protein
VKQKFREWAKRYLPPEVLSVSITLVSSSLTYSLTKSQITTALVGTWAGNIAYFGYILGADMVASANALRRIGLPYTRVSFLKNARRLVLEFGLAEVIDSLFIRPALMYYLPIWVGNLSLGVLLAKFAADVTFYVPAIISYELSKKYLRDSEVK